MNDKSDKRLLFITADEVTVYFWQGPTLKQASLLPPGEEGVAAFAALLAARPQIPNTILLDLVEEEFRVENIPHVLINRHQLLARNAARLFRAATWRRYQVLGREKTGRRDDRVLFSAITNNEILKPWIDVLSRHQAPLIAIHSVPYLIGKLGKPLGLAAKTVLIMIDVKGSGLRQTFFRDGQLAISRLALTSHLDDTTERHVDYLVSEIGRSKLYLQGLQLLPFDRSDLDVWLISSEERLQAPADNPGDIAPNIRLHSRQLSEIARQLGLVDASAARGYQANLVLAQLAASLRGGGYARTQERRYALHRTIKRAVGFVAMASLGAVFLWALGPFTQVLSAKDRLLMLTDQLDHFALLAAEHAHEEVLIEQAAKMRAAVISAQWLSQVPATPEPFLRSLGPILIQFPDFQPEQISWRLKTAGPATPADPDFLIYQAEPDLPADPDLPTKPDLPGDTGFRQIVQIKGQQNLPDANLRRGLLRARQFEQALRRQMPGVIRVKIAHQQPLDFRSEIALYGTSFAVHHSAPFDLQLVLRVIPRELPALDAPTLNKVEE